MSTPWVFSLFPSDRVAREILIHHKPGGANSESQDRVAKQLAVPRQWPRSCQIPEVDVVVAENGRGEGEAIR